MKQGFVQVYTGDGKGKTTAAIGVAVRAAGAGLRVLLIQFLKAGVYSECAGLARLDDVVEVRQYGTGRFVREKPSPAEIRAAQEGLRDAREALDGQAYDVVILDEAVTAVSLGLFPLRSLLGVIGSRPGTVELVLTGRGAPPALVEAADLVTEMVPVKHYYDRGIPARRGIES